MQFSYFTVYQLVVIVERSVIVLVEKVRQQTFQIMQQKQQIIIQHSRMSTNNRIKQI